MRTASPPTHCARVPRAYDAAAAAGRMSYGSACRRRYQDARSDGLEGHPCAALHGLVVLAEASRLPQSQGYCRGTRTRSICRATRTCSRGSSASIRAGLCRCWSMMAPCTSRATTSSSIWSRNFRQPRLIPAGHENEVATLLKHEDDLHLDLRTLSFRFVFAPPGPPKPAAALESYLANGAGTVQGDKDHEKELSRSSSGGAPPRKASPMMRARSSGAEISRPSSTDST